MHMYVNGIFILDEQSVLFEKNTCMYLNYENMLNLS